MQRYGSSEAGPTRESDIASWEPRTRLKSEERLVDGNGYKRLVGARILSEANDLKRNSAALAQDLRYDEAHLVEILAGRRSIEEVYEVIDRMERIYPIDGGDLRLVEDDCTSGARIMLAEDSVRSSRVFERPDATGELAPYYEYRDTACSRLSPFRPEWIRQLRVVNNADPGNPDVAFNNGHFLNQYTLYVGPVNFYWESFGRRYCKEMQTGDSSYGTPWWPHTFTSRSEHEPALILAITFGGDVRRAQKEFYALGARTRRYVLDYRESNCAQRQLIRQHMESEMMTEKELAQRLRAHGASLTVAKVFDCDIGLSDVDLGELSACLNVYPSDLFVPRYDPADEVRVKTMVEADGKLFPEGERPAYRLFRMARMRRLPLMKGFTLRPLLRTVDTVSPISSSLHTWIYNFGNTPSVFWWTDGKESHETVLNVGDSAYLQPFIPHAFAATSHEPPSICEVRVSGAVNLSVQRELSYFSDVDRIYEETRRWY